MKTRATLLLLALFALGPASAYAQPYFRVTASNEITAEGPPVSILIVQTDSESYKLRLPKRYSSQVFKESQSILFTSEDGTSAMTIRWTTNYPGVLPKMEHLRDSVAAKNPTASLVQTTPCRNSYASGWMFDLFQSVAGKPTLRMRDGFVASPGGAIEFTLVCPLTDYDRERTSFAWLLNSFRSTSKSDKKPQ